MSMTRETEGGCLALDEKKTRLKRPPMWGVVLLNDDYTTMDFVVSVLERNFGRTPVEAREIMMSVHKSGRGLAGIYTRDIAESLAAATMRQARAAGFPLRCEIQKQDCR